MLTRYRGLLPGPGTGTYIPSKDRFGKEAILFKILILLLYSQVLFNFDILPLKILCPATQSMTARGFLTGLKYPEPAKQNRAKVTEGPRPNRPPVPALRHA